MATYAVTTSTNKRIVTFDVSGTHFKVARSTLDKYQDSMLARLASQTWEGDRNEPIFVDANSERFNFVLDYMRHDEINVPSNISKDAVTRDLEYFCLPYDESQIRITRRNGNKRLKEIQQEMAEHQDRITVLSKEKDYIAFAYWCMVQKMQATCNPEEFKHDSTDDQFTVIICESDKGRPFSHGPFFGESYDQDLCEECLADVGLEITANQMDMFRSTRRRITVASIPTK